MRQPWWHRFIRENAYRDVWLLLTTGIALWAVLLTFSVANETHRSLCALRADLQRRVASSVQFLSEHPNGVPGIPARTIQDSIANQGRTIAALRNLDCAQ